MLTLFATPKAFRGLLKITQRNAIQSWLRLQPSPEVIMFGNEDGTAECAAELGLQHIRSVATNELGTPLISDLFAQAQQLAKHNTLCYVNCDIILMSDFGQAIDKLASISANFLMVGQRWDTNISTSLDFADTWEPQLVKLAMAVGTQHGPTGMDYFVFRKGQWAALPEFAVGRIGYDNWLIYDARRRGCPVIDASAAVMAIHQNHDYGHLKGGLRELEAGIEARRNMEILGGGDHVYTIADATWLLTKRGVVPAASRFYVRRRLRRWLERHPMLHRGLRAVRRRVAPKVKFLE
jgi:hypothetical protein